MLGAIAGDVIGSVYEWDRIKTKDFPLFSPLSQFTDDSVLTVAVAQTILTKKPYKDCILDFGNRYPGRGYGGMFSSWLKSWEPEPYNSFGNGSAMRVSPVGFAFNTVDEVLEEARKSAEVSHNHPEGIKGAQATALAVFLARTEHNKDSIRKTITDMFGYDLSRTCDDIRPDYGFDETCQGTVPEAIIAFLDSTDFEDAIRNAISLGGDSDTLACITGGIAEAFYGGVQDDIANPVRSLLPAEFIGILDAFGPKKELSD